MCSLWTLALRLGSETRREDLGMSFKCALCGRQVTQNVYFCSHHDWHLCWDCVRKAALTTRLTCPKCGKDVHRVD